MLKINFLYHFNEKYAPYAGTSMTSLLENNKHFDDITIYALGEGLSQDSFDKFKELISRYRRKIIFLDTEQLIVLMKKINIPDYRGSYAANMRLFLTDIIPLEVKQLVYLDSDTIIEGKLDEIAKIDMRDYPVGMVLDSLGFDHKRELGIKGNYYNSGIIVFKMDLWREGHYTEKIIEHIKNVRSHYPMPDQDLLNIICEGRILTLDPRYNIQPIHLVFPWHVYHAIYREKGYYNQTCVEKAIKNPVIYHFFRFCGEFPWDQDNVHPDSELFDRYLKISPWNGYKKVQRRLNLAFRIEKWMYRYLPKMVFICAFEAAHRQMVHKANLLSLKNKVYEDF